MKTKKKKDLWNVMFAIMSRITQKPPNQIPPYKWDQTVDGIVGLFFIFWGLYSPLCVCVFSPPCV